MTETSVYGARGATPSAAGANGSPNPLVVGPTDTTTPFSGTRLIEDGDQLSEAIRNKDWVSGGLATVAGAADALAFAANPVAGLLSMGVGWLLDHIEPLKGWLNQLTGDAGAVAGGAATWGNISSQLRGTSSTYGSGVQSSLGATSSLTTQAYTALAADITQHLAMVANLADAVKVGLEIAATIVQVVHDLVRDAIADIVGYALSCIIPLPNVIASVISKVASWAARLTSKIDDLMRSVTKLGSKLGDTQRVMDDVAAAFARVGVRRAEFPPVLPGRAPRRGSSPDYSDVPRAPRSGDVTDPSTARQVDDWAQQVHGQHPEIPARGARGLWDYSTDPGYDAMNGALRSGGSVPPAVQQRIDDALRGMDSLPPVPGTTYRGTNLPDHVLDSVRASGYYRDAAFSSSSLNPATAWDFIRPNGSNPAFFSVLGSSGVNITPFSAFRGEAEILFRPGSNFRVVEESVDTNGVVRFVLEEVFDE